MIQDNKIAIRIFFAILIAFAIPDVAFAYGPALQQGAVFDGITNTFKNSSSSWMNVAQGYAKNLFLSLAAIEFTWAAVQLVVKKGELDALIASTMLKVVSIGFFYSLLMVAPTWIPAIMESFGMAGAAVGSNGGGGAILSPSGIVDQGVQVAGALVNAMNSANSGNIGVGAIVGSGGASIGSFLFGAIVTGLAGMMTVLAFTAVAIQLMVTLIESYIVIGGGMLMMGFLGSRWTLPFGEKYFGYAVSTGIKLFTLYLIVGQGQNVANSIIHGLTASGAAPGPVDFMGAGASSLAYGAMGYMVPSLAGSMMNGSPALSMGNMMSSAAGLMGSMISAAALAGSTALSGMGSFGKTSAAAGNIGGDAPAGSGGGIGGSLPGSPAPTGAAGFGGGNESSVAAPPGMNSGSGSGSGSSSQAQPTPAPAAVSASGGGDSGGGMATPAMSLGNPVENAASNAVDAMMKPSEASKSAQKPEVSSQKSGSGSSAKTAPVASSGSGAGGGSAPAAVAPSVNISSKGGTDAIVDPKKKGIDFKKKSEMLDDMSRRMHKLPVNDGHSGGISIKFNHAGE